MLRLTEAACGVTVTDKFASILVLYCIVQCLIIICMPKHNHMLYEGSVWC